MGDWTLQGADEVRLGGCSHEPVARVLSKPPVLLPSPPSMLVLCSRVTGLLVFPAEEGAEEEEEKMQSGKDRGKGSSGPRVRMGAELCGP